MWFFGVCLKVSTQADNKHDIKTIYTIIKDISYNTLYTVFHVLTFYLHLCLNCMTYSYGLRFTWIYPCRVSLVVLYSIFLIDDDIILWLMNLQSNKVSHLSHHRYLEFILHHIIKLFAQGLVGSNAKWYHWYKFAYVKCHA